MGITFEQQRKLSRLIDKHVRAQIDLSWKGSTDPEGWTYTEEAAKQARKKLRDHLIAITVSEGA